MEWVTLAAAAAEDAGSQASLPVTGVAEVVGMLGLGFVAQLLVFRRTRDHDER